MNSILFIYFFLCYLLLTIQSDIIMQTNDENENKNICDYEDLVTTESNFYPSIPSLITEQPYCLPYYYYQPLQLILPSLQTEFTGRPLLYGQPVEPKIVPITFSPHTMNPRIPIMAPHVKPFGWPKQNVYTHDNFDKERLPETIESETNYPLTKVNLAISHNVGRLAALQSSYHNETATRRAIFTILLQVFTWAI